MPGLQAQKALDSGVNLVGYFCWSLLDSELLLLPQRGVYVCLILNESCMPADFEWRDGYYVRFGLVSRSVMTAFPLATVAGSITLAECCRCTSTLTMGRKEGPRRHCPGSTTTLRGMCLRHQACLMPDSTISQQLLAAVGQYLLMTSLSSKAVNV